MTDLLIVNPNTSPSITDLLVRHVSGMSTLASSVGSVHGITARFGAPYISCEASYAVAAHSALDAWAAWQVGSGIADHITPRAAARREAPAGADTPSTLGAILIGCFGDPGLMALRDSAAVPVTGLAEASFIEASAHGRFAIVTGGDRWKPMLQRLAYSLGFDGALAGIHTVTPSGAQLAADREGALRLLAQACREVAASARADAIILGGAGLAGIAAKIQPLVDVPIIDSVEAGARQAVLMFGKPGARQPAGFDVPWIGLSSEMTALGVIQD